MPVFKIHHITRYQYDRPVKESVNTLRIYPISDGWQNIRDFELNITNDPWVEEHLDYYGNRVGDFSMLPPHQDLTIEVKVTVQTTPPDTASQLPPVLVQDVKAIMTNDVQMLRLAQPEQIREQWIIDNILAGWDIEHTPLADLVFDCCQFIYGHFRYVKGITTVETTIDEILDHRSGVCQDFAHVMLQMLRSMGIPARYVSGYVCPNKSGMRGEGATHAWVEYFHPGFGWVGLDPTNNVWVSGDHVKLATGRDFRDCTPFKGTFKGIARQALSVYVSVGYEDGHVFEDINQVKLVAEPADGAMEAWQASWVQAQQ